MLSFPAHPSFLAFCSLAIIFGCSRAVSPPYGQLSVSGTQLIGASTGRPVQLHGMSLFWSQYAEGAPYWNATVINALKCKWNVNVVRAAMGVEDGGYLTNPSTELAKLETVIQAAIDNGIYVIVDWHVSATYTTQAVNGNIKFWIFFVIL